jgi:predicted PurR-regulated permease PerM
MNQSSEPISKPEWSGRQIFNATLVVTAIGLLFYLLFRYNQIVFLLFLAIVISTAIRPVVAWLNARGLPRAAGVIVVYAALLLALGGMVALAAPLLAEQAAAIMEAAPDYYGELRSNLFLSESLFLQRLALNMPEELALTPPSDTATPTTAGETTSSPISYVGLAGRGVLWAAALFVLGFYWTLERDRTVRSLLLWVPTTRRETARQVLDEIEGKVGGFVIGQAILCLAVGLAALIAYLLIGLPYALVLALLAGVTEIIPVVGPVLGAIPAMLVAAAAAPNKIWWVVLATLVIQNLEGYVLVPRIMKRSVGINSTVTLLAFVAFTALFGLGGALVSVPLAAILQLLIDRFLLTPNLTQVQQSQLGRDQISLYRLEAQTLAKSLRRQLVDDEQEGPAAEKTIDELEAITTELDSILSQFGEREAQA